MVKCSCIKCDKNTLLQNLNSVARSEKCFTVLKILKRSLQNKLLFSMDKGKYFPNYFFLWSKREATIWCNYGWVMVFGMIVEEEMVEGRNCFSKSRLYEGFCWRSGNCANVCRNEAFEGGHCGFILRYCVCSKQC